MLYANVIHSYAVMGKESNPKNNSVDGACTMS